MIFIQGGNGFLGSALLRYLKYNGINHQNITRTNYKKFLEKKCDIFINCSTNSKKYFAEKFPEKDFVETTMNVLNSINNFNFKKYILISSADVYGTTNIRNSSENIKLNRLNHDNFYALNKIIAEQIVLNFGKPYIIFRLGGLIGKNLKKNFIFDLIKEKPLRFKINSKFEFINTDDVANIIFNIINQKKYFNQIFNLSGDGQMSIKEIVDLFSRNKKKKIIFHKNKKLINYKINTNKIESIIKLPKTYNTIKTFFKINHDYNKNTN